MKYTATITIFNNYNAAIIPITRKVEPDSKASVLKQVRALVSDAMKDENLLNVQITISKK